VAGKRPGTLQFEGRVGGRLFETFETASGGHVFENGRITAWEPPSRLMFVAQLELRAGRKHRGRSVV